MTVVSFVGNQPPLSVQNAYTESGQARVGDATNDESSDAKQPLPRIDTRTLAQGQKKEKE